MLEADSYRGCIKYIHYYVHPFIETYVLETHPYRGCIKHIRKLYTCIYVLETDSKRDCIQHVKS